MHVVHTESVKALGGQTLRLYVEARELERRGHACTLVGIEGSEFHARAPSDVTFVPFRYASRRMEFLPLDYLRARKLLRRLAPDVVHTHSSRDAWVFGLAARSLSIPIVRGRHTCRPLSNSPIGRLVYTRLADAFTASGETIRRMLVEARLAHADDVFITPGSLDLQRFASARRDREFLRRELSLPADSVLIGTACNVRDQKGVDTLLDAFEIVARATENVHVVHAGKNSRTIFDEYAARWPGRVHCLGFRQDIERVIGGLDVFVLASKGDEATSQVIPQAMALGVPVVATSVGGIPDVVRDGETGLLVPPVDPPALAAGLSRMLALPQHARDALTGRASELVHREFANTVVVDRYEQAYTRAIAKRARFDLRTSTT